jgi:hypothetical protein
VVPDDDPDAVDRPRAVYGADGAAFLARRRLPERPGAPCCSARGPRPAGRSQRIGYREAWDAQRAAPGPGRRAPCRTCSGCGAPASTVGRNGRREDLPADGRWRRPAASRRGRPRRPDDLAWPGPSVAYAIRDLPRRGGAGHVRRWPAPYDAAARPREAGEDAMGLYAGGRLARGHRVAADHHPGSP